MAVDAVRSGIQNDPMSRKPKKGKSGKASNGKEVEVLCPCCETRLLVDTSTGVILREDRKKKPAKSFEGALGEEKARRAASDEVFGKALKSQKDQQDLLERKFQEAMKKAADEPDEKPPHPMDWD
jgi:hypothetical protein